MALGVTLKGQLCTRLPSPKALGALVQAHPSVIFPHPHGAQDRPRLRLFSEACSVPSWGQASAVQSREDERPVALQARLPGTQPSAGMALGAVGVHAALVSTPATPRVPGSVCFRLFPRRGLRM